MNIITKKLKLLKISALYLHQNEPKEIIAEEMSESLDIERSQLTGSQTQISETQIAYREINTTKH